MNMKHVLFVLTNSAVIGPNQRATGYFFPEVAHPQEVFDHAGIAVEYASPLGGTPPEDGYDETDPAQKAFRDSSAIRRMARSRKLSEVDVLDYDAVFFPGGLGPMVDIAADPEVKRVIARAWDAGRVVAAVCHGPAALLGVTLADGTPLLRGRQLTSFSNEEELNYAQADVPFLLEDALRAEGAQYSAAAPWSSNVVVDGKLVTGQNPASGAEMARSVVALLQGEQP